MAPKKAPNSKKKHEVESVDERGFFPTPSSVTPEELEEAIRDYAIPQPMVIRPIPGTNGPGLMHTPPGSSFTLPLFALRAGLSLPLSLDHIQIFRNLGLPLCQLTYNAYLLINSYLIISRWFRWQEAARNFTHLFSIVQYRPNKWEYSLKFKSSNFVKIPNNPHSGKKSRFVYATSPANLPFAPASRWTRGKVEMVPRGERTIPARDLSRLESLQWDAESLSVRDTLRAAGLVFPFDHQWSTEERSRRRSYLGDQMAFRLIGGAKGKSHLRRQGDAEFESRSSVQFQREVTRETDAINESLSAQGQPLNEERSVSPQPDPTPRSQPIIPPEDSSSSPPNSPPRKRQKSGRMKRSAAALNKRTGTRKRSFVNISQSPSRDATADQEDASLDAEVSESENQQPPPVDLNQEPPSTELPPDATMEETHDEPPSETVVDAETNPEVETPQDQRVPPSDRAPESQPEESEQTQMRRRSGKQVLSAQDEEMQRRCDAQSGPQVPPSGPGQSSQAAAPEMDPSTGMPLNWPYDLPQYAGIAAYDHRGFFGFHPYPMPTFEEIQRQLSSDEPCLLTLSHPQQCTDRALAIMLDTVAKMNLSIGQEIFYRHRYHGQRVDEARAAGLRRGERRNREARELASARIQSLEAELSRLQGELSAVTTDFSNLTQSSTATEAELKESLSKIQEELDTTRFELQNAQLFLRTNQDMRKDLESQLVELRGQLESSELLLETAQSENEAAAKTANELSSRVRDQAAEIDHLRGEVDRLQGDIESQEAEFATTKDGLTAQLGEIHVETAHTLAQVRTELALEEEKTAKAQEEATKAREELAKLREESAQAIARSRLEGARAFRASNVFKHLAVQLACPLASQLWDNCIGQASYLRGYKEDFDPNTFLDMGKDAEFREYVEEAELVIDPADEFASLQFDEEEDANIIPLGLPEGSPQPPQYPPPQP